MANIYRVIATLFLLAYSGFASAGWTMSHSNETVWDTEMAGCRHFLTYAKANAGIQPDADVDVRLEGTSPASRCAVRYSGGTGSLAVADVLKYIEGSCPTPTTCGTVPPGDGGSGGIPGDFCKSMASGNVPFRMTGRTGTNGVLPESACYLPSPPFEGADANKGCSTKLGDLVAVPNPDGSRSWSGSAVLGASVCTEGGTNTGDAGSGPVPPKAAPNPCPSGFPGTVNGASVCVPSVPDSGVGGVTKKEVTNADGSKEVTDTSTECNAGICTTTTTKRNYDAAGNAVGSPSVSTVKESVTAKCAANPGDKVCKEVGLGGSAGNGSGGSNGNGEEGPSSFGGDCAAGFKAVSDDAVINAMAEETFRQNCKVNPDAMSQVKGQAANAADPVESIKKDNGAFYEREITSDMIQQTDYIGSGEQCMPDKSISIHGQSFLIPFSNICDPMRYIGLIAVAASLVLAYRIIGSNK